MAFRWTCRVPARHGRRVLSLLALCAGWLTSMPAWAANVANIAVAEGRVVIRFDSPVAHAHGLMLESPRQIAVDVAGIDPGKPAHAGGIVKAIRQMRHGDGTRITFDLAAPAVIADGGFDAQGRELTLSVRAV